MDKIEFFNETNESIEDLDKLKGLIKFVLKKEKLDNVEFNIIFVDNNKIRELNKSYRDIDKSTDVITFALEDYQKIYYNNTRVLGDIYISLDKAKEQSIEYGHSYLRELSFLMVHGFLHLLGYDHINKDEEEKMFKKQEELLNEYKISR
jgi:probable rRNA maturation factor